MKDIAAHTDLCPRCESMWGKRDQKKGFMDCVGKCGMQKGLVQLLLLILGRSVYIMAQGFHMI